MQIVRGMSSFVSQKSAILANEFKASSYITPAAEDYAGSRKLVMTSATSRLPCDATPDFTERGSDVLTKSLYSLEHFGQASIVNVKHGNYERTGCFKQNLREYVTFELDELPGVTLRMTEKAVSLFSKPQILRALYHNSKASDRPGNIDNAHQIVVKIDRKKTHEKALSDAIDSSALVDFHKKVMYTIADYRSVVAQQSHRGAPSARISPGGYLQAGHSESVADNLSRHSSFADFDEKTAKEIEEVGARVSIARSDPFDLMVPSEKNVQLIHREPQLKKTGDNRMSILLEEHSQENSIGDVASSSKAPQNGTLTNGTSGKHTGRLASPTLSKYRNFDPQVTNKTTSEQPFEPGDEKSIFEPNTSEESLAKSHRSKLLNTSYSLFPKITSLPRSKSAKSAVGKYFDPNALKRTQSETHI